MPPVPIPAPLDRRALDEDGFTLVRSVLAGAALDRLLELVDAIPAAARGRAHGVRWILRHEPRLLDPPLGEAIAALARQAIGPGAAIVRSILFDKNPAANWKVAWHQDRTIAVAERIATPGFDGWSLKEGVWHTQPPAGVLERMATIRIHLDPCPATNGALRVLPGSHRLGLLGADAIRRERRRAEPAVCEAFPGDVLVMRPLVLHASSAAVAPTRRRILHLELAAQSLLPAPLAWAETRPLPHAADAI